MIQRYLEQPFLLNDLKFDLRLYVLLAGVDPLRIFLYNDGLARFATQKYRQDIRDLGNTFIHLTNYSINKHSKDFIFNKNSNDVDIGHKQSVKAVFKVTKVNLII